MVLSAFIGILFVQATIAAQPDTISLDYCYSRLESHYPISDKIELQRSITDLNRKIARTGHLPDLTLNGSASYQSDVTEVTFAPPGAEIPTFSKDHYKVGLDIAQPIYDGGMTNARKALEESMGEQGIQSVEVQLHQLREQVNRVYFSVLLLQRRVESIRILIDNLSEQLKSVRARVRNGVLLSSQASILEAELIRAEQDLISVDAERAGALEMLGILIDDKLDDETGLEVPLTDVSVDSQLQPHRPEYRLFDSSRELLENRISLAGARKAPKISAFATTAYGRPGLDAFNDDLQAYYIVGVRLRWNFWEFLNAGRDRQIYRLEQSKIDADEEAFTRQLQSSLAQLRNGISALREVIGKDEEIIRLSKKIVDESSSQLNEGVITATEYVAELNRLNQAQLGKQIHEVQLQQMIIEYQTKQGETVQ